jgi:small-conductance mechanosensitive channel
MVNLAESIQNLFQTNQTTSEIIASIIIFSLIAVAGGLAYTALCRYMCAFTKKTNIPVDNCIFHNMKISMFLIIITAGTYYTLAALPIIQPYSTQLSTIFMVIGILVSAFIITKIANSLAEWHVKRNIQQKTGKSNHILFLLKKLIQITILIAAFLVILWFLEVDLSGVVVGLGVGGIAIAFAMQNTLSDVFSAFSIYFDRPFEIGDFVVIGDHAGAVTNIGIKSTRIKLLQGEELVISNRELTSTRVRNFRKLDKRRVTFTIGVTYDTPLAKLKKIPQIISDIIKNIDQTELIRVNFTEFGDYSLKFVTLFYVNTSDYGKFVEIQEEINFSIKEIFEKEEINIAFPTQTIYVAK